MTPEERDEAMRVLARAVSEVLSGTRADIAIGAAVLYVVSVCDWHRQAAPTLDAYAAGKLRKVADVLDPPKT